MDGGISDGIKDKDLLLAGLEKALELRPDWDRAGVASVMRRAWNAGRTAEDVATAIAVAASDNGPDGTKVPGRILQESWWLDNMTQDLSTPPDGESCSKRGHEHYRANKCTACKVEARITDDWLADFEASKRAGAEDRVSA